MDDSDFLAAEGVQHRESLCRWIDCIESLPIRTEGHSEGTPRGLEKSNALPALCIKDPHFPPVLRIGEHLRSDTDVEAIPCQFECDQPVGNPLLGRQIKIDRLHEIPLP